MTEQVKSFKAGDVVYSVDGQKAEFVAYNNSSAVVMPFYFQQEDEEREELRGNAEVWHTFYATPPLPVVDEQIEERLKKIAELRKEEWEIKQAISDANKALQVVKQEAKKRPDLADFALWLEGKVTHLVTYQYGTYRIGTVAEVLTRKEDYQSFIQFTGLYVDTHANRYFTAHTMYRDGSGDRLYPVIMAKSLEDAKAKAWADAQKRLKDEPRYKEIIYRSLNQYGIALPDDAAKFLADVDHNKLQSRLESARKALGRAQQEVAEIEKQMDILAVNEPITES
jgi:hypothetical protein